MNQKNNKGETPLFFAIGDRTRSGERGRMVNLLLSKGAHVNALDCEGHTALHRACRLHIPEMIDLLIRRGADISLIDARGNTAFSLLMPRFPNYYADCTKPMIRELAKGYYRDQSVNEKDLSLLRENPLNQDFFV